MAPGFLLPPAETSRTCLPDKLFVPVLTPLHHTFSTLPRSSLPNPSPSSNRETANFHNLCLSLSPQPPVQLRHTSTVPNLPSLSTLFFPIRIEILGSRQGEECCELPSAMNTKPRKNRRRQKKSSAVQKLYDICKEAFATAGPGIIPASNDIQRVKSVLDGMREVDVGLSPSKPYFRTANDRVPNITYLHLHECSKFSIGIFCLPPSGVIPLHNHPGMTVFSKLLFGTMHIKSYDWAVDVIPDAKPPGARLAKVKVDSEFAAPNTSILYPADGGNMHCFTALTPCAVLDVLCPPYSDRDGRHCAYYLDFPFSSSSVDGVLVPEEEKKLHAWLQERDDPEDFTVVGAPYSGPKIIK